MGPPKSGAFWGEGNAAHKAKFFPTGKTSNAGGRRCGGVDWMMIDFIAAIGIAGTLSGIFFAVVGYKKGLQKESLTNGRESGTLKADTEYIKRRIDDVLLEQKDTNKSINALSERVTRVEESTKQAHKRIDEMKGEME